MRNSVNRSIKTIIFSQETKKEKEQPLSILLNVASNVIMLSNVRMVGVIKQVITVILL